MYKLFTHLSVFHKFMTQYVFLLSCVRLIPVYVFLVLNLCISRYRLIKRRSGKKDPLNTCNRMTGGARFTSFEYTPDKPRRERRRHYPPPASTHGSVGAWLSVNMKK